MPGRRLTSCLLFLLLAVSLVCAGCVERKLTIRSHPTACVATLDGKDVGKTPTTVHFDDYGGREIILSKQGYHRLRKIVEVKAPPYQWLGVDFFFEMIWPFHMVDEHVVSLRLRPIAQRDSDRPIDTTALEERANTLQERAESYGTPTQ